MRIPKLSLIVEFDEELVPEMVSIVFNFKYLPQNFIKVSMYYVGGVLESSGQADFKTVLR